MNINRRSFIKNGIALLAAPAIVHAENIMKIAVPKEKAIILHLDCPGGEISDFYLFQKMLLEQIAHATRIPYNQLEKDIPETFKSAAYLQVINKS